MNRIWFMTIGMVSALCGCVQFVMADDSENLVHRFGELMSLWCESGDDVRTAAQMISVLRKKP